MGLQVLAPNYDIRIALQPNNISFFLTFQTRLELSYLTEYWGCVKLASPWELARGLNIIESIRAKVSINLLKL